MDAPPPPSGSAVGTPVEPREISRAPSQARTIDLFGATSVGVGAIVGGGILVLAGVALSAAGPSALIAFALNGVIAAMTALSFAELASTFPENGGAYVYAKKVLGVRPAFAVGWVLWFAYIVAGVLYALGFAEYAGATLSELWPGPDPSWLRGRTLVLGLAVLAAVYYTISLIRKTGGGGNFATWGKVVVFALLIVIGFAVLPFRQDPAIKNGLSPFFSGGALGVVQAMGFTFIALQGFEIIGAVGGEVKEPSRVVPKAMLGSLGLGLLIYLPLLFVVSTAGTPAGDSIDQMSQRDPATVMAVAVGNYLGKAGYWLVLVAGLLSTLSALRANILAASRVALTMAGDRTLPSLIGQVHEETKAPIAALYTTALALIAILFMVPDLAAAGAAASLIFLVSFAMGHVMALLSRQRSPVASATSTTAPLPRFRAPFFPWLPILGFLFCGALAAFQAVAVPTAGGICLLWLGLGVLLYFGVFQARANLVDASALANRPELLQLRGQSPVVLVPIANPERANELVAIASSLAPPKVGRVLLLNVVNPDSHVHGDPVENAQKALGQAVRASLGAGHKPQALLSVSESPWQEIRRVANEYHCHAILLGAPALTDARISELEDLVNSVDSNVSLLFAPTSWKLSNVERVIVPIGGRGSHHRDRARVIGGLLRTVKSCKIVWLRALPLNASKAALTGAKRRLDDLATDVAPRRSVTEVEATDDPQSFLLNKLHSTDLLLLGLAEVDGRHVFGDLLPALIQEAPSACLVIARGDEGEHLTALARQAASRLTSKIGMSRDS